jgi:hypothetical protein
MADLKYDSISYHEISSKIILYHIISYRMIWYDTLWYHIISWDMIGNDKTWYDMMIYSETCEWFCLHIIKNLAITGTNTHTLNVQQQTTHSHMKETRRYTKQHFRFRHCKALAISWAIHSGSHFELGRMRATSCQMLHTCSKRSTREATSCQGHYKWYKR